MTRLRQREETWHQWSAALLAIVLSLAGWMPAGAQPFQTIAPHAILYDTETKSVLFERAANELMAPASLVKLMTAEVVFKEIADGRLSLDDEFIVSENAWRRGGAPSGGSTMFAALNSRIKIQDLIPGLVVLSGNDAAIVLAEGIAGSEQTFATLMTERARLLGLSQSTFKNATGLGDPQQRTTARDMAKLADHVVSSYPDLYKTFGLREFTWNRVRQQNRNPLLAMDIGADGLKTGNIDESGFGLVGSAVQNGQRLIVVVNGLKNARDRGVEARKLLDWGFRSFETRTLFTAGTIIAEASVFGGAAGRVGLVAKSPVRALVPRGQSERMSARVVYQGPVPAPVTAGTRIGTLRVMRGDMLALEVPLFADVDVPLGSIVQRAMDAAWEYATGFVRRSFSRS